MAKNDKLGDFLREVSNWRWDEFCKAENDPKYSNSEATIFALVRACAMQKMDAIKIALNRIDGKLKTPINIETPKIYTLYPRAKAVEGLEDEIRNDVGVLTAPPGDGVTSIEGEVIPPEEPIIDDPEDLPSLGIRETLSKMADLPREVTEYVIKMAELTSQWLNHQAQMPDKSEIPAVKSVMAAHLLELAKGRNIDAISEVFDSIDGKLAETLKIGEDMYITNFSPIAPAGAVLNEDGIYQIQAQTTQDLWAAKLAGKVIE